jgi:pimeloyl-ACP methyl ester carboxylesterase
MEEGILRSRFWPGHKVRWRLVRPAPRGSQAVPPALVVALHGHGGNADWPFGRAHVERYILRTGLAVASIDGGNYYWHARRSGVDTGSMIVQSFLPLLRRKGLVTSRIGLIGWSMGGYGALLLASRLGRGRVAGVVAVSAALWEAPYKADGAAFDGGADFARNSVFSAPGMLRSLPVRLDCGRDDRFLLANLALARELPHAEATFDAGGHSNEFWMAHAGPEMSWLRRRFQ